jgi:predicted ATPase
MCPLALTQEAKMEVRFKNFRCFKDTGPLKLKKITLLVGENSSGKTSFLAGLNHISGLLSNEDINLNSPPFELGSFRDIFHASRQKENERCFEYESKIGNTLYKWVFEDDQGDPKVCLFSAKSMRQKIALEINLKERKVAFDLHVTPEQKNFLKLINFKIDPTDEKDSETERFYIQNIDKLFSPERFSSISNFRETRLRLEREGFDIPRRVLQKIFGDEQKGLPLSDPDQADFASFLQEIFKKLKEITNFSIRHRLRGTSMFLALAPLRTEPSRVYSFTQSQAKLTPDGRHIPDKLLKYSSSNQKQYNELQTSLEEFGEEAGLFQKIKIKKLTRNSNSSFSIMVKTAQGKESNIMDVGYGVSQILPVIVEIISSRKKQSFLLQQPEVHLHPRAQAAFATLVAKLTKEKKQFVIETHSDFILERLKYEIEQGNIAPGDVGILFFDTERKHTKIHQIDLGKDGLPKEPPASYRRFFLEELDRVWP